MSRKIATRDIVPTMKIIQAVGLDNLSGPIVEIYAAKDDPDLLITKTIPFLDYLITVAPQVAPDIYTIVGSFAEPPLSREQIEDLPLSAFVALLRDIYTSNEDEIRGFLSSAGQLAQVTSSKSLEGTTPTSS